MDQLLHKFFKVTEQNRFQQKKKKIIWICKHYMNNYMHKQASLVAQLVRICLQCKRPWFNFWVRKLP